MNPVGNRRFAIASALCALLVGAGLTIATPRLARGDDSTGEAHSPSTAPQLPAYFSSSNDPAKPSWPDPTGAASGV